MSRDPNVEAALNDHMEAFFQQAYRLVIQYEQRIGTLFTLFAYHRAYGDFLTTALKTNPSYLETCWTFLDYLHRTIADAAPADTSTPEADDSIDPDLVAYIEREMDGYFSALFPILVDYEQRISTKPALLAATNTYAELLARALTANPAHAARCRGMLEHLQHHLDVVAGGGAAGPCS